MTQAFTVDIPQAELDDLRQRIRATRWSASFPDSGWNYGFDKAYLQELAYSWAEEFDWRAVERAINAFPQYRTVIDGNPTHYVHVKGKGPKPIGLILSHGWPWTFWDMHKVIGPLADPAAYGGDPADAFDVVVPSLPGYIFSNPLPAPLGATETADLWDGLMHRLGYDRYAAAGADWGGRITGEMGHRHAASLYGVHTVNAIPLDLFNHERWWDVTAALIPYDAPDAVRQAYLPSLSRIVAHVAVHTVEPQTLAFALNDSPIGLLAWLIQRRKQWSVPHGDLETVFPRDHLLATATLYWVTQSFLSSTGLYAQAVRDPWKPAHDRKPMIEAPSGITFLGGENPPGVTTEERVDAFLATPEAKRRNIHYLNAHPTGGHFAHYENPQACIADIRATFRDLR